MSDPTWPLWILRACWLVLPATSGEVLAAALEGRSMPVATTAAGLAWGGWAVGLLSLLVPRPATLTALRVVAPWALLVSAWAIIDGGDGADVLLLTPAAAGLCLAFLPVLGAWHVNGPSYGDERRFPLRAPGALLAGPLPLAGLAVVPGVAAGPLLLAAESWTAGVAACAAGWGLAVACARATNAMSSRWLVFVPAGVVLKDHVSLAEPVLFRRVHVQRLGPAAAGTDALDLTAAAFGLALELSLREPYDLHRVVPGKRRAELGSSSVLLCTPTRPGAVVAAAASRRLPTA